MAIDATREFGPTLCLLDRSASVEAEPSPHRLSKPHALTPILPLGPWHGRLAAILTTLEMQMQRLVIACSILLFCASVAAASNFTPVKSAEPTKSALRQRLADEPKCWCMGSKPPPICTFATLCQSSGRLCTGSCD